MDSCPKNYEKFVNLEKCNQLIEELHNKLDPIDKENVVNARSNSEALIESFRKLIDPYQEQPELLEPRLQIKWMDYRQRRRAAVCGVTTLQIQYCRRILRPSIHMLASSSLERTSLPSLNIGPQHPDLGRQSCCPAFQVSTKI